MTRISYAACVPVCGRGVYARVIGWRRQRRRGGRVVEVPLFELVPASACLICHGAGGCGRDEGHWTVCWCCGGTGRKERDDAGT